ncbi:hypothetical protein KP509_02G094700 [Ceratopteris richardii]|nr:hypothetical protein KP509_02G094700 [Ceratopteris richardii]
MPGGPEAFELASKFCYGVAVDLTASCIAGLRCAAEYLEMTEDLEDGNLISKTEAFLSFVVLASWKDSITVLQHCEGLSPWTENLQIVRRCTESIAWKACTDPKGISWSFTGKGTSSDSSRSHIGNRRSNELLTTKNSPSWNELKNDPKKKIPQDWWIEDVISLNVQHFTKVIAAIRSKGMRPDLVSAAIVQYALKWIPLLDKDDTSQEAVQLIDHNCKSIAETDKDAFMKSQNKSRFIMENLVTILPTEKDSLKCSFLLKLLRIANMVNANAMCRNELERRVGMQLDQATLTDLLIPSFDHASEMLFDVDLVQRIVQNFLMQEQVSPHVNVNNMIGGYDAANDHRGGGATSSQNPKMKVAKLIDSYLAEVARDANMSVAKFEALAEEFPEYVRACDDGLYRAIDTYLKAHPSTSEGDRKQLCRLMDCQKLSLDACMHAAQNERLPLRVVVQVLFCEQVKLRNAITGSALSRRPPLPRPPPPFYDSGIPAPDRFCGDDAPSTSGSPSVSSPLTTARRDIRVLKSEVERMKSKYAELQADYEALQRQVERPYNNIPSCSNQRDQHLKSSTNVNAIAACGQPPRRVSGGWSSGLRKFFLPHNRPGSRLSMDELSGRPVHQRSASAKAAAKGGRRWRNSIS